MQLLRRFFNSSREKDRKTNKRTIAVAKVDRRRSSFLATDPMKRLTNFFGSSSSEEDVKQQQKQQTLAIGVTTATAASITGGTAEPTALATATATTPTTQIHLPQQTVQVGLQVPPTPPLPPKENFLTLPESPATVGVNGRQNAPRLSISCPSPASTKTVNDIGESPTPPMSGSNQNYGGLSPNIQPLPASPHPISPIASLGGGNRNFSGASYASYASYATTSSRPNSSHMNFPIAPSPAPSEVARGALRRKQRSGGGGGLFGKRKKDDVDSPTAWRLTRASTENLEGYDYAPLAKGEPVPDMWDDRGDTLVFLAPRNVPNPKFTAPSFRISSTPLLLSALGQYVEDTQYGSQDGSTSPGGTRLEPDSLFLDVPTGVPQRSSSRNFSKPGIPATEDPITVGGGQGVPNGGSPPPPELSRDARSLDQAMPDATLSYRVYYPALEFDPRPSSPPKDGKGRKHKHSNSVADETIQRLIDARNLFAFLNCNFLVGTVDREMPFHILQKVFEMLQGPTSPTLRHEDQLDANGLGTTAMAESNFLHYVGALTIDDLRNDDDAIVEALILAERWRCSVLYHEGFVHACGRWEEIKDHPGFAQVSERTKKRLDRASIDMHNVRIASVSGRLSNFDYPSIFTGDGKYPEYKPWRLAFDAMRKHTLSYYKHVYGSWPPRAGKRGKGGGYSETGGLNRVVLQRVYNDFSALYDLVVDREWIHGERIHFETLYSSDGDDAGAREKEESARTTIRKIQQTYDQSGMPVQPSMPFDLPRLPYIPATPPPTANSKPAKKSKSKSSKKLKGNELGSVLRNSYNQDSFRRQPPNEFAEMFKQLEQEFGNGKTVEDLIDARRGRWLFIYCVCQSLPLVVVDAPGVRYSDRVEYFLCKNLKGTLPWQKAGNRRASRLSGIWVPGPGGLLSAAGGGQDSVDAGDDEIEYVYRKSHCWTVAEQWRMVSGPAVEDLEGVELEGGEDTEFLAFQQSLMGGSVDADTGSPDMSPGVATPPFHGAYSGIDGVVGAERNSIQYYNPNNQVPQSPQDQIWAGQPVPANAQDLYLEYLQRQELLRQQFEQQLHLQQQRQSYLPASQGFPPFPPMHPADNSEQPPNSRLSPPPPLWPLQIPDETNVQYQPSERSPDNETVPRTQEEFTKYRQAHFEQFQRQRQASPSPPPIRLSSEDPAGSPSLTALPGSPIPVNGERVFSLPEVRPLSPPRKAHTWGGQFDP
ncbi:unnamed protein product [Tuber melanosporum]|uniref:(Perigord truffle) hypothetical protein n=1 Tax=Tuber melanosporum (strain Mel28) TaxID=656061 RepID=D5GFI5_TUBMM|nr:uncharacterized protein GSTUM_00006915001 [Tuber melanosporum]CAZ83278.1 unnamed protein product [Tuber melanosporum]